MKWNEPVIAVPFDEVKICGIKAKANGTAVMTADRTKILAHNSNRYQLITNEQLCDTVFNSLPIQFNPNEIIKDNIWCSEEGTKFVRNIEFDNEDLIPGCRPCITLKNNYSAQGSATIMIGLVRIVCSNGMWRTEREFMLSFAHIGNIEKAIRNLTVTPFQNLFQTISSLKYRKVLSNDLKLFNDELNLPKYVKEQTMNVYLNNSMSEDGATKWGLYQAFTYVLSHNNISLNAQLMMIQLTSNIWR